MLNIEAISRERTVSHPFPHLLAHNVLTGEALKAINLDFPAILGPGLYPISALQYGPSFAELIQAIEGEELERILSEKYGLDLSTMPLMVTVRGFCRARDGRVHVDTADKVVTCLLYLNEGDWAAQGGRLRLLGDGNGLDNVVAEASPAGGTFVSFRRTENSWHGHASYAGRRRYVMFNWMTGEKSLNRNLGRHRFSAAVKRLLGSAY